MPATDLDPAAVEAATRDFHETYERLAPEFGYRTREESAKPWEEVPEQNKALMRATVAEVLTAYLDRSGLAEARASLERERKARHAAEKVNADEVLRKRTNLEARIEVAEMERDEARASLERITERLEQTVRLASRWHDRAEAAERDVDRLMRRAIQAEADLAVCREALAELAEVARLFSTQADYTVSERIEEEFITVLESAEALSRLAHSSEEER